jgi:hypothetical protein
MVHSYFAEVTDDIHDCRQASEGTTPTFFCQTVFSVQCSVAVAAHLPLSFRSSPPLAESRKRYRTSGLDAAP